MTYRAIEALKHIIDNPARYDLIGLGLSRVAAEYAVEAKLTAVVEWPLQRDHAVCGILDDTFRKTFSGNAVGWKVRVFVD